MAITGSYIGTNTVYQLTNGIKQDVSPLITFLDPTETPLLNGTNYNGLPGQMITVGAPASQEKIEWLEENILLPYTPATATISSSATTLTVGAEHQSKFRVGDVCSVSDTTELVRVTAYVGTTQLTITRGFAGSTAAAITATTSVIRSLGPVLPEGSDPGSSVVADRVQPFNYTRIFGPYKLGMSGTAQVITRWGVADEMAHQLMNLTRTIAISQEQAMMTSTRYHDTTTGLRTFGGIDYWIRNNGVVDSSTTQITATALQTNLGLCNNQGHIPTALLVNPGRLHGIDDIANTSIVRQEVMDGVRGRQPVTLIATEYGDLQVVRSRYCDLNRAYLFTPSKIQRRPLRAMAVESLAKTGDSDNVMLLAEESLQYAGASQECIFTGLTTA